VIAIVHKLKSWLKGKVKTVLGNQSVFEFGRIKPNPRFETFVKAVEIVQVKN